MTGFAVTTNVSGTLWTMLPLVPLTVMAYVPGTAAAPTVAVTVVDPDPTTDVGAKPTVVLAGTPVAENAMVPANPPKALEVTV